MYYRYDYDTPDISQLHPITNNTNPLYIQQGNPNLTPVRSHYLNLSKFSYTGKWKYRIYTYGRYKNESIINTSFIDGNGVTYSKPVNFDGTDYSISLNTGMNRTFEMDKQKISTDLSLYGNFGSRPFSINGQQGDNRFRNMGFRLNLNYNLNDILDFAPTYGLNFSHDTYKKVDYSDVNILSHYLSGDFTIYLPWDMEFQNDLSYRYQPQTTPGFRKSSTMWNAALNKKILPGKKLTIRLSAYDILDQNIDFYRYVRYNTINDVQQKTLTRYLMLSLIYDFRKSGGGNSSGMRVVGGR